MTNKPNILIVDDNRVNRCLLDKILSGDYNVLQAENGSEALELLKQEANSISAILLDLAMPVMDGFTFMELAKDLLLHYNIPVIVTTQNDCEDTELEALSLGATDFIAKPYRPRVILKRLENILHLKENSVLRNTVERDALTGIYNQETFFVKSHELMESNSTTQYAIICMDIEHFKLVNELQGTAEGDQLLKAIARELCTITTPDISICARISGDIFGLCMPYYPKIGTVLTDTVEKFIHRYAINLKLNFKFGIYVVDDITLPISGMCDRSKLAIQSIKGKFDATVALYDDSHRKRLIEEQEIISQMRSALAQGQFIPYYQPKYNLITGEIVGAEALIRWIHPTKGIIPPQRFIELFEKNGFISAVDFHIWECVCQHLRKVLDQGKVPLPISVNVSRVDVYNPQLCSFLQELINKYRIEPRFLELEITENSYIDNAEELIKTINDLKKMGFTIEMDDFGSGYSSLNMLSDVPVDVIKLDMRFLQSKNAFSGQRNILNFIVSLAKWLDIQTVAEGVETLEQVSFLRSIGYSVGQGYYFARPMPQEDYEKLAMENQGVSVGATTHTVLSELLDYSEIWNPTSQFNIVFKMFAAPLALWEFTDGKLSFLRGNDSLGRSIGFFTDRGMSQLNSNVMAWLPPDEQSKFYDLICKTCKDNSYLETENRWLSLKDEAEEIWLKCKINIIFNDGKRVILLVEVNDITAQKNMEEMVQRASSEFLEQQDFFEHVYDSIPCGIVQFHSGSRYFSIKNLNLEMVKILGYSSKEEFWNGECDPLTIIVPKFLPAIKEKVTFLSKQPLGTPTTVEFQIATKQRDIIWVQASVQLVVTPGGEKIYQCVFIDITRTRAKLDSLNQKATKDPLTGLYNRRVFEGEVKAFISSDMVFQGAFLILDIDNFKYINDTFGHQKGDEVLKIVSEILTVTLRTSDIISRLGGDEFAIFLKDLPSEALAVNLAKVLCKRIAKLLKEKANVTVTCSIGISLTDGTDISYDELYKNADSALYKAKELGKNQCYLYGQKKEEKK